MTAQAALADLKGELETLTAQQSVTIQALNTFMIQKLYRTVDELNSRIAELESKLNFMS